MKNIYLLTLLIIGLFASCLSESDYDIDYPTEYPMKSVSDLDKMVRGVYRYLYAEAWSGNVSNDAFQNHTGDDVRGVDNPSALQGDAPYFLLWNNWEEVRMTDHFSNGYRNIALCNEVIDFIDASYAKDEVPFRGLTAEDNRKIKLNCDRIKGEMHFLRALTYHMLTRSFCPPYIEPGHSNNNARILPYKIHFDKTVEGNKNPEIGTVQQLYDLMVSDLKTAKEYLPETYDAAVHDPGYKEGHSTRWAASALLARVYFYRREWKECEAECSNVIENGPFTLENVEPLEAWIKNCGETTSPEVIYEFASSKDQGGRPSRWTSQAKNWYNPVNGGRFTGLDGSDNGGKGYFNKSTWTHVVWSYSALEYIDWWTIDEKHWDNTLATNIVDKYTVTENAKKDKRYVQLNYRMEADPTAEQLEGLSGSEIQTLYPDSMYMKAWNFPNPYLYCDKYYRAPDGQFSKTPYLRLPELLLNRALIKLKFGIGTHDALTDINTVRTRAGLDPLTALTEDDIHKERMKEMSMEVGDRRFYLMALDMDLPIGDRNPAEYSPIKSPYSNCHIPLPVLETDNNDSYKDLN